MSSFDVIIPNYNGRALLQKNLPAVLAALELIPTPEKRVILVDDGSDDDSVTFIESHFPQIQLIKTPVNRGFIHAINLGASSSKAEIIMLLNSDVEPHDAAFLHLYRALEADPHLFAVSGSVYSGDKKQYLYGNRGGMFERGHFKLIEKEKGDTTQTLFVCGGAGAFRRDLFLSLGGFDPLFAPMYYEEQDLSYRALKRNMKITFEPRSIVYHSVQGSVSKKMNPSQIRLLSARNNYLFVLKNITNLRMTLEFLVFTPIYALLPLFRGESRFLLAFLMAIPRFPRAIQSRLKEQKSLVRKDSEIFELVH